MILKNMILKVDFTLVIKFRSFMRIFRGLVLSLEM